MISIKGPCTSCFHAGPEQKGTGQILFVSNIEPGHKDFLTVLEAGQVHFLVK